MKDSACARRDATSVTRQGLRETSGRSETNKGCCAERDAMIKLVSLVVDSVIVVIAVVVAIAVLFILSIFVVVVATLALALRVAARVPLRT